MSVFFEENKTELPAERQDRESEIAGRIAQAREAAGMKVADCARVLRISVFQYRHLERHFNIEKAAALVPRLAEIFNITIESLIGEYANKTDGKLTDELSSVGLGQARWLGNRAIDRREQLALPRTSLAELVGIPAVELLALERCFPRQRHAIEPKWEEHLQVPQGWLRNTNLQAALPPSFPALTLKQCMTVAEEMRIICCWFSRRNPYFRTNDFQKLTVSEQRTVEIMAYRYGVLGSGSVTLQEIGKRLGLTRQRIQQIVEGFGANLAERAIDAPMLYRLKQQIQERLPCSIVDLDVYFHSVLGESLSVTGVDRFLRDLSGIGLTESPLLEGRKA